MAYYCVYHKRELTEEEMIKKKCLSKNKKGAKKCKWVQELFRKLRYRNKGGKGSWKVK